MPEHPDLGLDVSPLARCLQVLCEQVIKLLSHVDDSVGHALYFALPLSVKLRGAENGVGDPGSMENRTENKRSVYFPRSGRYIVVDRRICGRLRTDKATRHHVLGATRYFAVLTENSNSDTKPSSSAIYHASRRRRQEWAVSRGRRPARPTNCFATILTVCLVSQQTAWIAGSAQAP